MPWRQVLVALLSTILMVRSSPCSWVEIVSSWNKGYKAVAKIQIEETVDHWDVNLEFSESVINVEAWKGPVNKISDSNYTISNTCYNNMVYSCQCFELPYLVRHEPMWKGNITFKFNGAMVPACDQPSCDDSGINHSNFNEDPMDTRFAIESFYSNLTKQFNSHNNNFQDFLPKGKLLEKELLQYNYKHIIINISESSVTSGNTYAEKRLANVWNIFQTCETQSELDKKLDEIVNDELHQSVEDPQLHEMDHHIIEAASAISKIIKNETQGGTNELELIWKSYYVDHIYFENFTWEELKEIIEYKKYTNCISCVTSTIANTVFLSAIVGTITGCNKEEGISGCVNGTKIGVANGISTVGNNTYHAYQHFNNTNVTLPPCIPIFLFCFAGKSQVETLEGKKYISELVIGDFVRTSTGGVNTHFTEFLGWMRRQHFPPVEMLQVSTSDGKPHLTLTGNHIVFTSNSTVYADELRPGDGLMYWNGSKMVTETVTKIQKTVEIGAWAPLTKDGTLLVDGFLSSCYASFPHQIAELFMIPVKMMSTLFLDNEKSQHEDGVRSVANALKKVGEWIGVRERIFWSKEKSSASIDTDPHLKNLYIKTEF